MCKMTSVPLSSMPVFRRRISNAFLSTKYRLGVSAVGQQLFHLGSGLAVGRVCSSLLCEEGGVLGLQSLDSGELL